MIIFNNNHTCVLYATYLSIQRNTITMIIYMSIITLEIVREKGITINGEDV